jgi:hypothetical protein
MLIGTPFRYRRDGEMDKNREARRVTRAISLALALIAEHDPELARMLSQTIETGQYLSYAPQSKSSRQRKSARAKKTPQQGRNPIQPATR